MNASRNTILKIKNSSYLVIATRKVNSGVRYGWDEYLLSSLNKSNKLAVYAANPYVEEVVSCDDDVSAAAIERAWGREANWDNAKVLPISKRSKDSELRARSLLAQRLAAGR